jgi:hypothetical protein
MSRVDSLRNHLKRGKVYRRTDLTKWSKSVDRHLDELVEDGTLKKLSQGMYYYPKKSAFGEAPPNEQVLVRSFLRDDRFLVTSPNAYNSLGAGTTQLYNTRMVYNHKRHGEFMFGKRKFLFQVKHHFPKKATQEFLVVDLVNNLEKLAEDNSEVLTKVLSKAKGMNQKKLTQAVKKYGNSKTQKVFTSALQMEPENLANAN